MDRQSSIDLAISEARSYLGCKWRHRGRSKYGIDCLGIVVNAMKSAGFPMRDRINYGREPWKDGLSIEMREHFGAAVNDMRPGDVVVMCADGQPEPGHVGLIANIGDRLTLIHSYNACASAVVVEHGIDEHWLRRIVEIYRPFP